MYHLRIKHIIVLLMEQFKFGPHDTRYQQNEQQNGIAKTGYAVFRDNTSLLGAVLGNFFECRRCLLFKFR